MTTTPHLTPNELELLFAIADSDFQDANPIVNNDVWVWSVDFPSASHGGVAASLQKKGMIGTNPGQEGGDTCWLTQAGVDALVRYRLVALRADGSFDTKATAQLRGALSAPPAPPAPSAVDIAREELAQADCALADAQAAREAALRRLQAAELTAALIDSTRTTR